VITDMFALGASSLAPLDRHLTPLASTVRGALEAWPTGRTLVVGGATTPAVDLLLAAGHSVTIAEPSEWVGEAEDLWPTADVAPFDSWAMLDYFPLGWFSQVLLLGGVIETGGPWWGGCAASWSVERLNTLKRLLTLVPNCGPIYADYPDSSGARRITVAARGGRQDRLSLSFATDLDDGSVALTTHRYRYGVEEAAELRIIGRARWGGTVDGLLVTPTGSNTCTILMV
jgi:hypothetical protein